MINLELDDDQRQLLETVTKFTRDEIIPVAGDYDKSMKFPWDVIKKAHNCGFINANISTEYGKKIKTNFLIF